jgi:hypothetical protein
MDQSPSMSGLKAWRAPMLAPGGTRRCAHRSARARSLQEGMARGSCAHGGDGVTAARSRAASRARSVGAQYRGRAADGRLCAASRHAASRL